MNKEHIIGKPDRTSPNPEVKGRYGELEYPLVIERGYEYHNGDWRLDQFYTVWVKGVEYAFVGRAVCPRRMEDFDHRAKIVKMIQGVIKEHGLDLCEKVRLGCGPNEFYLRHEW